MTPPLPPAETLQGDDHPEWSRDGRDDRWFAVVMGAAFLGGLAFWGYLFARVLRWVG